MGNLRVFITGSSGFIGGALLARFIEEGWSVTGNGRRPFRAITRPHLADYLQHNLALPLDDRTNKEFDVIIHSAAKSSPWGNWKEFECDNVTATSNLLQYAEKHGQPRFVYISSPTIYTKYGDQVNIRESSPLPLKKITPYAKSKYLAEKLVRQYQGEWTIIRPRAVFGPHDTTLFPRLIRAAKLGRLPWIIRKGPEVKTDLTFIDTVVDVVYQSTILKDIVGEDYNITNNEPVILHDFLKALFQRVNIPLPQRSVSHRKAAIIASCMEWTWKVCRLSSEPPLTRYTFDAIANTKTFDVSKMLNAFGEPRISIADGVRRFVDYLNSSKEYQQ